jgi:mRNA interferase YafQ
MKNLSQTAQFARDVKRMRGRGKDVKKLKAVVRELAEGKRLEPKHRDHALGGPRKECRDCHIESDRILIYSIGRDFLRLERTGTHSDLFE